MVQPPVIDIAGLISARGSCDTPSRPCTGRPAGVQLAAACQGFDVPWAKLQALVETFDGRTVAGPSSASAVPRTNQG